MAEFSESNASKVSAPEFRGAYQIANTLSYTSSEGQFLSCGPLVLLIVLVLELLLLLILDHLRLLCRSDRNFARLGSFWNLADEIDMKQTILKGSLFDLYKVGQLKLALEG